MKMVANSNLNETEKLPIKFELNTKGKSCLFSESDKECEYISLENFKTLIFDAFLNQLHTKPRENNDIWYVSENFENLQTVFVLFAQNVPFSEYCENKQLFDDSLNLFDFKFNYQADFDRTSSIISELCKVPVNCTSSDGSSESVVGAGTGTGAIGAGSSSSISNLTCSKLDLLLSHKDMISDGYSCSNNNFINTKDWYDNVTENSPMFAIDCEMCQVRYKDRALARISIVDENHNVLYDTYVKPKDTITNYLTKFSGIRKETLKNCRVTLQDVQKTIRNILPVNAILVGHSLNFDLNAMEMMHPYVIDTSTIYNLSGSSRYKPSLKQLANEFLGQKIQQSTHCSIEDAKTAMKLVQLKLSKGILFGDKVNEIIKNRTKPNSSSKTNYYRQLSYYLKKLSVRSAIIGNASQLNQFEFGNLFFGFQNDSFTSVVTEAKRVIDRDYRNIISFVDFKRKNDESSNRAKNLEDLNCCLTEIWNRIATMKSLCIVILSEPTNRYKSGCFIRFSASCSSCTNQ